MTKKHPQSKGRPEPEPESDPGTDRMAAELSKTLAGAKSQKAVEDARVMVEEHESRMASSRRSEVPVEEAAPDTSAMTDREEVFNATTTLTGAVDQMVPSLLLAIHLTSRAVRWMKFVTFLMFGSIVLQSVILAKSWDAAEANR